MNLQEPFVDIHCHLLPGLDDGPATVDAALAMAERAVAEGIGTIVATPHQLGGHRKNSGAVVREAAARLQTALNDRGVPLRVLPGGEMRIEPDLIRSLHAGETLTLANRRRHALLELPSDVYLPLDRLLADLHAAGLVGILAHPERNRGLQRNPGLLRPLVRRGCLLQITADSLVGNLGDEARQVAETLLRQGLVHFVATDAHGTRTRPPVFREAFRRVRDLVGQETALQVCCRNPASVATGADVVVGPHQVATKRTNLTSWVLQTFFSETAVQ
ncbi:MAG: CpsB/CapC family capsule biosynthesis tyrosine phosphatase [Thermoguttaceae bacterium]